MRELALGFVLLSVALSAACNTVCPAGKAKSGDRCVWIPDAGHDASDSSDSGESSNDAGPDHPSLSCKLPDCDPCALPTPVCANDSVCSADTTAVTCTCKAGFSGPRCELDACVESPCEHGTCKHIKEGRTCECEPDWQGDACDQNTNAALANLTVSAGKLFPSFKPNVYEYSVDVGIATPELTLTATAAQPEGVVIKVDGQLVASGEESDLVSIKLNVEQTIVIDVIADLRSATSTYRLSLRRTAVQQAYVKAPNAGAVDAFGQTVAVQGDVLVVGAPGEDSSYGWSTPSQSSENAENSGAVYVFRRLAGTWQFVKVLKAPTASANAAFGAALAFDGTEIFVGEAQRKVGDQVDAGAVHVYRDHTTNGWSHVQTLSAPTPRAQARFGRTLSLSGSSLAVAERSEDKVHLWKRNANFWKWEREITAVNSEPNDDYGVSIALDESRLLVGAPYEDGAPGGSGQDNDSSELGAVHSFEPQDGSWPQTAYLKPDLRPMDGIRPTLFGFALAAEDKRALVCAPGGFLLGPSACFGFEAIGQAWRRLGPPLISPSDPLSHASGLGAAVATSKGTWIVGDAADSANSSGVDGEPTAFTVPSGAVFVFRSSPEGWTYGASLKASNPGNSDGFGSAVAADGETVAVGAFGEDSKSSDINGEQDDESLDGAGAVYIFHTDCAKVPSGADVPGC